MSDGHIALTGMGFLLLVVVSLIIAGVTNVGIIERQYKRDNDSSADAHHGHRDRRSDNGQDISGRAEGKAEKDEDEKWSR